MKRSIKRNLFLLFFIVIMVGCVKGGGDKNTVTLGETYTSASVDYTVTEDKSAERIVLTMVNNNKFDDLIFVNVYIYPKGDGKPIQTSPVSFNTPGESQTFLLPFTVDCLPLYINFQEEYVYSQTNSNLQDFIFNWGFRVVK